ncbi:MAG: hypothetical protein QN183_13720 [Armatimonadota bacterium]|nr:hypothetical protein [Armatimonadota bacterium]
MGDWLRTTAAGALKAALTAAVAYVVAAYAHVPLDEPYRTIVALVAVALWNRYAGARQG